MNQPTFHDGVIDFREEPIEGGMYVTQSGKFIYRDNMIAIHCWAYFGVDSGISYFAWDSLKEKLGESEFPLRKAKAVAE